MTPGARVAAAIELLDLWLAGGAPEQLLTSWARGHRFAGSGDRAAIRDHVYEAIRCRRSFAALGGAETGRGLMLGALRARGEDPAAVFTGEGHAPAALAPGELPDIALEDLPDAVRLDVPDWLVSSLKQSLGVEYSSIMGTLRARAPVFLRVNAVKGMREDAQEALAAEGIATRPHMLSPMALEVTEGARKIQNSNAFRGGLVELQDVASQALVDELPVTPGEKVLDYCAGGGGKSLALAARGAEVVAHDVESRRMADLPVRAARAGIAVKTVTTKAAPDAGPYDLVFADAPCSGSGAWRRSPQGKWALTAERLDQLCAIQAGILDEIAPLVAPGGALGYATCSLLDAENGTQIRAFLARHPDWHLQSERRFTPRDGGDGFYVAVLTR